ncbi:hypothetical protein IEO21_01898 [Rhodonia placenta]|uniref:Uncharacterized protein n=1 Tax=Rhodonia placenta TaxID=104341 RepID=A0A8H7P933_9APHY|nr:hypothetical protein IEO21_01898 [Postia placenta]
MDAVLNDDHPLALELASLRNAIARYQHEAHATSVKLQRHSLDTSYALERTHALESENSLLKAELAVLRAHPEIPPHPAALQVQELTIAHRRLSDKLTLTEGALLEYTAELAHARSDVTQSRHEVEATRELAERLQTELKDAHAKERELGRKARAAEEERKLSDLVVQEYADLVRNLEGRPRPSTPSASTFSLDSANNNSSATLVDSLSEGKSGLQKLLEEFNSETERLETEVTNLQGQTNQLQTQLTAESRRAEDDRVETAQAQFELEKHKIDDNTAAKMVSRYMKFSQSSTDSLQKAMEGMKARHTATAATLRAEVEHLQKALLIERRQSEKLRHALDELTEDISREAYGRRREIALRLAFLGREEHLAEGLRRWIRRAREAFERALHVTSNNQQEGASAPVIGGVFKAIIRDADDLLDSLNGQPSAEGDPLGSVARIVVAQNAASTLARELQAETDRRLALERQWAQYHSTTPVVHVKASVKAPVIEVFPSSTPDVFSPVTTSPLDELKISPLTSQLLNGESTGSPSSRKLSLLPELLQVQHRYDSLQRGFRDCNLSLKDMKKDLSGFPHGSEMVLVLQKAVERLDDYNEDVRVELEIRVTDEARITSGYEALLTIPGAMSDEVDQEEMEVEIQAFVDGTDKAVAKAMQLFSRKLDDLEHDIAAVKRSLHELASTEEPHLATTPANPPQSTSPAPTFGSVMTSPRLRQTSFSHPRKASDDSASGSPDPFASLGLRIPMPAHVVPASPPQPVNARQRVASATYMLGLGARSTFGFPSKPSARSLTSAVEDAKSGEGDPDSDVE